MNKDYDIAIELNVIRAYLVEGCSHRDIQKNILGIPAPSRGGGFVAMNILHKYGIYGEHKAKLKDVSEEELLKYFPNIRTNINYSELIKAIAYRKNAIDKMQKHDYAMEDSDITEKLVNTKQRLYQSVLRERVLSNYQHKCAICGLDKDDLLVCSHIKPWAEDKSNRLNPRNAICLCVLHDKLFDKGYFSLDNDYNLLFGEKSDSKIKQLFYGCKFNEPDTEEPDLQFLSYHRYEICGITE